MCVFSVSESAKDRTGEGREPRPVFAWPASSTNAGVAGEGNGNQMTFLPLQLVRSHRSNRLRGPPKKSEARAVPACDCAKAVAVKLGFTQGYGWRRGITHCSLGSRWRWLGRWSGKWLIPAKSWSTFVEVQGWGLMSREAPKALT